MVCKSRLPTRTPKRGLDRRHYGVAPQLAVRADAAPPRAVTSDPSTGKTRSLCQLRVHWVRARSTPLMRTGSNRLLLSARQVRSSRPPEIRTSARRSYDRRVPTGLTVTIGPLAAGTRFGFCHAWSTDRTIVRTGDPSSLVSPSGSRTIPTIKRRNVDVGLRVGVWCGGACVARRGRVRVRW